MIESFEKMKKQLTELAGVINEFKSEAVQLKIVEFIFSDSTGTDEKTLEVMKSKRKTATVRKKSTPKKANSLRPASKKVSGGLGAHAMLTQLLESNFFKEKRTIGDITTHCKDKLASTFKSNELSGKLIKMVKNNELTREKNQDGQYEYKKP